MKSIGLFYGVLKILKGQKYQWIIWTIPLHQDEIPWVPETPMAHHSSLS